MSPDTTGFMAGPEGVAYNLIRPLGWFLMFCFVAASPRLSRVGRFSLSAGAGMFVYATTVFAFTNAGYAAPEWLFLPAQLSASPAICLFVGGAFIEMRRLAGLLPGK